MKSERHLITLKIVMIANGNERIEKKTQNLNHEIQIIVDGCLRRLFGRLINEITFRSPYNCDTHTFCDCHHIKRLQHLEMNCNDLQKVVSSIWKSIYNSNFFCLNWSINWFHTFMNRWSYTFNCYGYFRLSHRPPLD